MEAALRWSSDMYTDSLASFANGIRTVDGGTHLDGLKTAVSKSVAAYIRKVSSTYLVLSVSLYVCSIF